MTDMARAGVEHKRPPENERIVEAVPSDLVISEGRNGWTLAISPSLLTALTQQQETFYDGRSVTITVRPNLVPGEPFVAQLRV